VNHLLRELAPISDAAWQVIEDEVKPRLTTYLAARKLVDFSGPNGWTHSATAIGRSASVDGPTDGVTARQRQVLPLVELRAEFTISRAELDDADRGATDLNLDELDVAARRIALAENALVFGGYRAGGMRGISEASSHGPIALDADFTKYAVSVAMALNALRDVGIGGPYGLAISPEGYTGIIETSEPGDLLIDHLHQILGGPVVWAPGVAGGVVLSLRGGDFVLDSGQDLSIGYLDHSATAVRLYLEESFSFRVLEPSASVVLTPASPAIPARSSRRQQR
jgi:uncharacterized linocin/CFP29 family protein